MVVGVVLVGGPGNQVGVGVFGLHEAPVGDVVPGQHLGSGPTSGHEAVACLLRPLPVGPEVDRLRQVDAGFVVGIELGEACRT